MIRLIYNGKQIVFGVFVLDLCSNIMITRIFNVFFFMTRSFILSCMIIIVNAEMSKQDWLQTNICKKRLKIPKGGNQNP